MINLSLNKLRLIAKSRGIKDYKNKSKEYSTKILSESKPKKSLFKKKIKEIKKDLSQLKPEFSKSKISKFIKSLFNIKIQKNLFAPKIKGAKKSLYNLMKYYDCTTYQGIRDTENLFGKVDEDNYKAIKTKSAFNHNYIKYESKEDKDKNLWREEYVDKIKPYLRDMINDHKTRRN